MVNYTQRTILLVDDLTKDKEHKRAKHLAKLALGLSEIHNVIVVCPPRSTSSIKNWLDGKTDDYAQRIQVLEFSPASFFHVLRGLSASIYRIFWYQGLVHYLKRLDVNFDLVQVITDDRYPIAHFMWRLKQPVIWGELENIPCVKREMIIPFFGMGAFIRHSIKRSVRSLTMYIDPFLAISLYKTERIMLSVGSCTDPLMVDPSRTLKQSGFPVEMPKKLTTKSVQQGGINFMCAGPMNYTSGFDLVLKSFAAALNQVEDRYRSKMSLFVVGKGQRSPKLINLVKDLGIASQVVWLDNPSELEMNQCYENTYTYFTAVTKTKDLHMIKCMAYGIPVVAVETNAISSAIGEAGIKISLGSYEQIIKDMAFSMKRLMLEPELAKAYGLLSLSRYRNHFTYTSYVQLMLKIYEDVYMRHHYYKLKKLSGDDGVQIEPLSVV